MLKIKNYHLGIHRQDRARAVEILVKDLKVFSSFNEELFKEITQLQVRSLIYILAVLAVRVGKKP